METKILKSEESFYEFPDGILEIHKKSNLVYIKLGENAYLAKEVAKSVTHDLDYINYEIDYFDVRNNDNILGLNIKKSLDSGEIGYISNRKDLKIIPLINILNIKGNNVIYFTLEDVDTLINYKEEEASTIRKTYF